MEYGQTVACIMISKGMNLKSSAQSDSAGVLFLRLLDIPTAIITGEDTEIVKRRAVKLGINDCYLGIKNKLRVAKDLCEKYSMNLHDVAYIGDDINDIALLKNVGLSAAPANAPTYIKDIVDWPLLIKGGDGAFRAFVEKYLIENNLMEKVLQIYLDNNESLNQ